MSTVSTEEFKYFVINTPAKWREGMLDSTFVDREGRLSLTPMQNITQSGEIGYATGLAFDPKGNLFIIDALNCLIFKYDLQRQTLERLMCSSPENCGSNPGQFKFNPPRRKGFSGGLAFGKSTLYIADTYNHRIQAFYLPGYQINFILQIVENCQPVSGSTEGEFHTPKDVVTDRRGNFYVLDYENERIQKFSRRGKFISAFRRQVDAPQKPESIAIDREDVIYIVDSLKSTVEKFNTNGEFISTVVQFGEDSPVIQPSGIAVDFDGIIYVGEKRAAGKDDLSIYQFDRTGKYLGRFGRYQTICYDLTVDCRGNLFAACDGAVFHFNGEEHFQRKGAYYSRVFDSTIIRCHWHRLALEVQPAEKSNLEVFFSASDVPEDLHLKEIDDNDAWVHFFSLPHSSGEVKEALLPGAMGRYLRLKFEFFSDGTHSYRLQEAQLYFQRLSYLRYLPATYQEDEAGRDFLERYLSIFETMNLEIEQQINHVTRYFDPEAVEGEFLDWLSSWLAVTRDENWPEKKRKELLQNAFRLYKKRGTPEGLEELVSLLTGGKTAVIEHYRLKTPMVLGANTRVGRSTVVGKRFPTPLVLEEFSRIGEFALKDTEDPPEQPFEEGVFDFTLLTDTAGLENQDQLKALQRLVEEEKPAYTRCFLRTGQNAALQLGVHALLEVDTKLSNGLLPMRLGISSHIGKDAFLGTKYCRKGTIGMRSTIAVDTILH